MKLRDRSCERQASQSISIERLPGKHERAIGLWRSRKCRKIFQHLKIGFFKKIVNSISDISDKSNVSQG